MATRWARLARGLVAAVVSVFVALCSHAIGGGVLPSFAGLALCLAFATLVSIALAGKALSLPRLSASVVASQFVFHALFSEFAPASGAARVGMPGMHSLSGADAASAPLLHSHESMPAWMWLAHAIAAVITIAALRFGERTFWMLVELVVPAVARMLRPTTIASERPLAPWRPEGIVAMLAPLSPMRHRGPPVLSF